MENLMLEAIKFGMAIIGMTIIALLLLKNMKRCAEVLDLEEEIKELKKDYQELFDKSVEDISILEENNRNLKLSYENKIDKLEEVINNLEKNN